MSSIVVMGINVLLVQDVNSRTPNSIVGSNVAVVVEPTLPCTTFGFSVEQTVTLPVGYNISRMVRVDRRDGGTTGYMYLSSGGTGRVVQFDLNTLAIIDVDSLSSSTYSVEALAAGEVSSSGLFYFGLEMFSGTNRGLATCPIGAGNCLSLLKYENTSLIVENVDEINRAGSGPDDIRESGGNILVGLSGNASSVREFRTYDSSSLEFSATGTLTPSSAQVIISRPFNGFNYAARQISNGQVYQLPAGSPTASLTTVTAFGPKLATAIYGTDINNLLFVESDTTGGGIPRRQSYNLPSLTDACTTCIYNAVTALAAARDSTFYDSVNERVFSVRTDGITVKLLRTLADVQATYTPEELFTCPAANCGVTGLVNQSVDYAPQKARLYIGSGESPAKLSKIKVCAVGGP